MRVICRVEEFINLYEDELACFVAMIYQYIPSPYRCIYTRTVRGVCRVKEVVNVYEGQVVMTYTLTLSV